MFVPDISSPRNLENVTMNVKGVPFSFARSVFVVFLEKDSHVFL